MRNQTWENGELVTDIELYLDEGILKVKDHITDNTREPTEAETEQFYRKPPRDLATELDDHEARLRALEKEA
jgi:hypothetical protein